MGIIAQRPAAAIRFTEAGQSRRAAQPSPAACPPWRRTVRYPVSVSVSAKEKRGPSASRRAAVISASVRDSANKPSGSRDMTTRSAPPDRAGGAGVKPTTRALLVRSPGEPLGAAAPSARCEVAGRCGSPRAQVKWAASAVAITPASTRRRRRLKAMPSARSRRSVLEMGARAGARGRARGDDLFWHHRSGQPA